jgi:DHA2 family multidrug resistance protein
VNSKSRFDLLGFATVAPGFVALLYGLSQGARKDWSSPAVLGALAVGAALLTFFVLWELHLSRANREPLVDLRLFRLRSFWAGVAAFGLLACVLFWPNFIMPIYLQSLRAMSAAQAGLIMATLAAGSMIFALLGGWIADRIGARTVALVGVIVLAIVSWLFSRISLTTPLWQIAVLLGARGMSSGLSLQPLFAAAMIDVRDPAEVAHGSTLTTMFRNVGGAIGTGLLVSLAQMWAGAYLRSAPGGSQSTAQATQLLRDEAQMVGIQNTFLLSVAVVIVAMGFVFLLRGKTKAAAAVR